MSCLNNLASFYLESVGSCLVDKQGKAHNLGHVQGEPVLSSNGSVIMYYRGGEACDGSPSLYYSTHIYFYCSPIDVCLLILAVF